MASNNLALGKAMVFVTAAHLVGRRGGVRAFRVASRAAPNRHDRPPPQPRHPPSIAVGRTSGIHALSHRGGHLFPHPSAATRLGGRADGDGDDAFEPTWDYVPYRPPPGRRSRPNDGARRRLSAPAWTVPDRIPIPEDRLTVSFVRASGAGGQNVNKVSTKVELRFHVASADWIPAEVRERLGENESNRISNEGFMTVTSQEHRTQVRNRGEAIRKLELILRNSWARPKVRKMRKGLTRRAKENRKETKKKTSMKKENRRRVDFD